MMIGLGLFDLNQFFSHQNLPNLLDGKVSCRFIVSLTFAASQIYSGFLLCKQSNLELESFNVYHKSAGEKSPSSTASLVKKAWRMFFTLWASHHVCPSNFMCNSILRGENIIIFLSTQLYLYKMQFS